VSGKKTEFNNQFGLVSLTGGDLVPATPLPAADGDGLPMLLDEFGRPWVRVAGGGEVQPIPPQPGFEKAASRASIIGAAILPVSLAANSLYWCSAMNDKGSAAYLQVFNSGIPVPAAVPDFSWRIPNSAMQTPLLINFGPFGLFLSAGLTLVVSDAMLTYVPAGVIGADHTLSCGYID